MGEELNLEIIQETQVSLGKFIKKPQLSEKLLRKPPFKFLHDIMTSVINTTGFMKNVYTREELSSENIKDRDKKIAFLQKAIDHVVSTTGDALKIQPNKTVAGHEAGNTNEFLQALARAITVHSDHANGAPVLKPKSPNKSPVKNESSAVDFSDHRKSRRTEQLQLNDADQIQRSSSGKSEVSDKVKLDKGAKSDVKRSKRETTSKTTVNDKIKKSHRENSKYSERDASKKSGRDNSKVSERDASKKSERENNRNVERETKKKSEKGSSKNTEKEVNKKLDREGKKRSERETVKKLDKEIVKNSERGYKLSEYDVDRKKSEVLSAKKTVSSKERDHSRENGDVSRHRGKELSQSKDRNRTNSSVEVTKERRGSRDSAKGAKTMINDRRGSYEKNQGLNSPEKSPKKRIEDIEENLSSLSLNGGNMEATVTILPLSELSNGDKNEADDIKLDNQSQPLTTRMLTGRPPTGRPLTTKSATNVPSTEEIASGSDDMGKSSKQEITSQMSNGHDNEQGSEIVQRPRTSTIRRSSARPPTARPAAPRVRLVDSSPEEPQSSQELNKQVTNIILDGDAAKDNEDDDNFLIEENNFVTERQNLLNRGETFEEIQTKPHGSLVTQILETKRDLESGSQRPGTGFKRVELDKSLLSDSARKKEREVYSREMDHLRDCVQTLTRSANPLGKLIDYLQEDVDTMLRELDIWSSERRKHELTLQKEESKADLEFDSLQHQLQEIEESIEDQAAKISSVKANIIRNEERIQKMIAASRI